MVTLRHGDARLIFDPAVGNIPLWEVTGRKPLHAAPWRDEPEIQENHDIPLVNRRLAGDFLCAPFGLDDVEGDPIHGFPANSIWEPMAQDVANAQFRLQARVRGAVIEKDLRLTGPVLYQTHRLSGGEGQITLAHHPMSHTAAGGRLSFSPKRAVLTDPMPQYEGRNLWALNQIQPDLLLPCEDGSDWDLHVYPAGHAVEDFVILAEARESRLGWTVLIREAEDDMLLVLKDPRVLPITMLWISNGGRDFSPWNGRHTGVLGIEDGIAAGGIGLAASTRENRLTAMGIPTCLTLGPTHLIRHAMVSLPRPPGWARVVDIQVGGAALTLTEASGETISVPFDEGFFPA
ncbi:hypothetical protein GTA62_10945 [Roseobacter sp. HKCCD9010]|uniref:hypothetical protein n=1 Tax=unclassified Roseobacter TaxID=196798 RepID=UPI001490D71F|nr:MULTISPECIES: hypothetical protein [unclassified Roseobacter]MBF9050299.1 hypothetical protein [Rhodobacterales bacterium HKCCD4356]NNV12542.1 hypothetical protein [Roseobacter sp. HKCCD7357]NNV15993.1 hypothetical protein [Roseobacter sp. HKCCD8768]NNV25453.1 hypothetical protein [Roseobacter sp. HKCCD8192]NNV29710.1 hypothetical protein [Roseobacter sp. HKCCD9061]